METLIKVLFFSCLFYSCNYNSSAKFRETQSEIEFKKIVSISERGNNIETTINCPNRPKVVYVSNNGKSIEKNKDQLTVSSIEELNHLKINPGDSILFERESTFFGQFELKSSGTNTCNIYIGSYGKGKNATISGDFEKTSWERKSQNIWFTKSNLLESPWWVVTHKENKILRTVFSEKEIIEDSSYFLDAKNRIIYIKSVTDPNTEKYNISKYQHGILINKQSNIVIENINFQFFGYSGIILREDVKEGNCLINKCSFYGCRMNGIVFLNGHSNNIVTNCSAQYNGNGYYSIRSHNNWFISDTLEYNICYNKKGMYTDGHGIGLFRSGDCVIEKCFGNLNEGGSVGFDPDADNKAGSFGGIIRYNYFKNAMNASACIGIQDLYLNSNLFIYYNKIENYIEEGSKGFGIYSGFDILGNLFVYNNTIIQMGSSYRAVAFRKADNVHFKNNIVLSNQKEGSIFEVLHDGLPNNSNNIYYNLSDNATLFKVKNKNFNTLRDLKKVFNIEKGSFFADPKLKSKSFFPERNSPVINKGVDLGLSKDINQTSIIGSPDIGCYETKYE